MCGIEKESRNGCCVESLGELVIERKEVSSFDRGKMWIGKHEPVAEQAGNRMDVELDERESGMGMEKSALGPLMLSSCICTAKPGKRGKNSGRARKWR